MGAAWRGPKERDLEPVLDMVRAVKALGLETCATLGMLKDGQAEALQGRGPRLLQPQSRHRARVLRRDHHHARLQDRLDTLDRVRDAGINVCCGGIVGMGESRAQRAGLIAQLANLDPYPESVPINHLVQVEGTPLHERSTARALDPLEFVRTIAVARITMPQGDGAAVGGPARAGRRHAGAVFLAGANSIFYGDKLLTTGNPDVERRPGAVRAAGLARAADARPQRRCARPHAAPALRALAGRSGAPGTRRDLRREPARASHRRKARGSPSTAARSCTSAATIISASPTIRA